MLGLQSQVDAFCQFRNEGAIAHIEKKKGKVEGVGGRREGSNDGGLRGPSTGFGVSASESHLIFCSFHLEHWALMLQGWNAVPLSPGSLGAVLGSADCGPFVAVCAAGWYLHL